MTTRLLLMLDGVFFAGTGSFRSRRSASGAPTFCCCSRPRPSPSRTPTQCSAHGSPSIPRAAHFKRSQWRHTGRKDCSGTLGRGGGAAYRPSDAVPEPARCARHNRPRGACAADFNVPPRPPSDGRPPPPPPPSGSATDPSPPHPGADSSGPRSDGFFSARYWTLWPDIINTFPGMQSQVGAERHVKTATPEESYQVRRRRERARPCCLLSRSLLTIHLATAIVYARQTDR